MRQWEERKQWIEHAHTLVKQDGTKAWIPPPPGHAAKARARRVNPTFVNPPARNTWPISETLTQVKLHLGWQKYQARQPGEPLTPPRAPSRTPLVLPTAEQQYNRERDGRLSAPDQAIDTEHGDRSGQTEGGLTAGGVTTDATSGEERRKRKLSATANDALKSKKELPERKRTRFQLKGMPWHFLTISNVTNTG